MYTHERRWRPCADSRPTFATSDQSYFLPLYWKGNRRWIRGFIRQLLLRPVAWRFISSSNINTNQGGLVARKYKNSGNRLRLLLYTQFNTSIQVGWRRKRIIYLNIRRRRQNRRNRQRAETASASTMTQRLYSDGHYDVSLDSILVMSLGVGVTWRRHC